MAKSWKKVIKSDTPDSQKNSGESASLDSVQLTLDEITAQNEELAELMKGNDGYAIEQQTKRLSQVTDAFAARRMDLTVKAALSGRNLNEIEDI